MAEKTTIDASIIIPAYNAANCIGSCLEALQAQSISRERYEIIVVDDGSTDDSATIAAPYCDRIVRTENRGPASARNTGVEASQGDIVLFTDSDCIPLSDWLEKMLVPFERAEISGVKGAYQTQQTKWVARFVQAEYEVKYGRMSRYPFIDFIDTYSAGFRRSVFRELGGFDTSFPGASVEDQEFSFRVANAGYKMVFVPAAIVYHRHADTLRWYFRKKMNIGFWKVMVMQRHPSKMISDSHTPQSLKLQLPVAFAIVLAFPFLPFAGWFPVFFLLMLFVTLGLSETLHCYRRYGIVSAAGSPIVMWVRSIGLGIGLIRGFLEAVVAKFT